MITKLFRDFFNSEKSGGLILVFVTIISLVLANSFLREEYTALWHFYIGGHTLTHWINDGLMAIFFLLIGLELEREIYKGELSGIRNAALPFFAAMGGMAIPAGIFSVLNYGTPFRDGTGIPTATDIAFAIGVLSLLGSRAPASLKVFLTAVAVVDDLGAIIIIAIFYTSVISYINLAIALGIFGVLLVLNRLRVYNAIPYLIGGVAMWYFMLHSGVHATITGVLLAFALPFGDGSEKSTSYIIQHYLHKPVPFIILPLFALANTAITLGGDWYNSLVHLNSIGIILGLVIGKPLGIALFSYLGTRLKLCALPTDLTWKNIISVGFLGGIGFTMSIFITLLAFKDTETIISSKIAVLVGSVIAGALGYWFLKLTLSPSRPAHPENNIQ